MYGGGAAADCRPVCSSGPVGKSDSYATAPNGVEYSHYTNSQIIPFMLHLLAGTVPALLPTFLTRPSQLQVPAHLLQGPTNDPSARPMTSVIVTLQVELFWPYHTMLDKRSFTMENFILSWVFSLPHRLSFYGHTVHTSLNLYHW